uniref:Uncharacterized protein n=1 Tax=Rhizophora mucronata TaxID=61149 RepID=A0A2P2NG97_RHIMU
MRCVTSHQVNELGTIISYNLIMLLEPNCVLFIIVIDLCCLTPGTGLQRCGRSVVLCGQRLCLGDKLLTEYVEVRKDFGQPF